MYIHRLDKQTMIYSYKGLLFSYKNSSMQQIGWISKNIILSGRSQDYIIYESIDMRFRKGKTNLGRKIPPRTMVASGGMEVEINQDGAWLNFPEWWFPTRQSTSCQSLEFHRYKHLWKPNQWSVKICVFHFVRSLPQKKKSFKYETLIINMYFEMFGRSEQISAVYLEMHTVTWIVCDRKNEIKCR